MQQPANFIRDVFRQGDEGYEAARRAMSALGH